MADPQPPAVEGEAEEIQTMSGPPASTALERRDAALAVAPQVEAAELVKRLDVIKEAAEKAMTADVDYGVIPGTNKPALLKPGAEKLAVLFQLDIQVATEERYGPGDHLTARSDAVVYHAPTGARLGSGKGICTTRERKYAVRQALRRCPACDAEAIIKGKAEYGGGWVCFKKKGGCGAKYDDGDEVIESQTAGEIPNPDLPDTWNTVLKMADKRARVDAVLAVTAASALFTQDIEDRQSAAAEPELPEWAQGADERWMQATFRAVAFLLGARETDETEREWALGAFREVGQGAGGIVPLATAKALTGLAAKLRERRDVVGDQAAAEEPEPAGAVFGAAGEPNADIEF